MEYRKIISFGKNSFVVSIPKPWIRQNKLGKGDLIYIEENETYLVLHPRPKENQKEERTITITVDKKSISQIQRELIPAYINNNRTIILVGEDLKKKAATIEPIIQNLIALEIMEQTSTKIVARDFLDMKDISIMELIRKMDVITRAMLEDCLNMYEEDTYTSINHRDKDVNRLSYLIFRAINFGFENPTYMLKKYKLDSHDLLHYYLLTHHLEATADDVRRIARYMQKTSMDPENQKKFTSLLAKAKQNYLDTLKAFYTQQTDLAQKVAERKANIIKECEQFIEKHKQDEWIGSLVTHFKRLIANIHKLGRIVYE